MPDSTQLGWNDRPVVSAFASKSLGSTPSVIVHSRREREAAAASWLLLASPDARKSRIEWEREGVTLLRCGALLSAVRIPAPIVYAAAGTEDPHELTAILGDVLDGPVFYDRGGQHFYALTPHSTSRFWRVPETECLGSDYFLGVPATNLTEADPRYRAWWVVPMDGPALFCLPAAVACFVQRGLNLISAAEAEADGA